MNDAHMKIIGDWISAHAEEVQSKLPDDPRHPNGRNAIAHFHTVLQWVFNVKKTRDISDADFSKVMEILKVTADYAPSPNINTYLLRYRTNTLESYLED